MERIQISRFAQASPFNGGLRAALTRVVTTGIAVFLAVAIVPGLLAVALCVAAQRPPLPGEDELAVAGMLPATAAELDARWRSRIAPELAGHDLPRPAAAGSPSGTSSSTRCVCAPTASSSAKSAAANRST